MQRIPLITTHNTVPDNPNYYGYIYLIVNLTNGMCYVGQKSSSTFVDSYWGSSVSLKHDIDELGTDNFARTVIDWCLTLDELNASEEYWIKSLNLYHGYGYNQSKGGKGLGQGTDHPCTGKTGEGVSMYGKHHSNETRDKMSKSHIGTHTKPMLGKDNPFYGKHHSEETKRIISEKNKGNARYGSDNGMYGRHHSDSAKQAIRNANLGVNNHNYGKHLSQEAKEKQRVSHLGKISTSETKQLLKDMWSKPITMVDSNGNITDYPYGALSIGRNLGISGKTIWNICIRNSNEKYNGCQWKFTKGGENIAKS